MIVLQSAPAIDTPHLGEIDKEGRIWTTCGWSIVGPAWVTESQIPPTVGCGWQQTGRTADFMGAKLFELVRR